MKDVVICEKSRGADKQATIRECPNGVTPSLLGRPVTESIGNEEQTEGTETSKYLEE